MSGDITETTLADSIDELVESARSAMSVGRWDDAVACYTRAIEQTRELGGEVAELLRRVGQVHYQRGEFKLAEEFYDSSIAAAREAANIQHEASALNCQGNCQQSLGRLDRAETLFIAANELAQQLGNRRLSVMTQQNLGTLANIRGDTVTALQRYRSALEGYEDLQDDQAMVWVLNNMAMAYVDLERYTEADGAYTRALAMAEMRGDADLVGTVQVNRAELFVHLQMFDEARVCCDQAFEIFGRLESSWGLGEAYKAYGIIYREGGKLHLADAHLELVIELAHDNGNALLEAEGEHERALVALIQGKKRDALKGLNRAQRLFSNLSATRELFDIDKRLNRLEESYLSVVATWGESIESKDAYTAGHCRRVADYATRLAQEVGFSGRDLNWIRMGGFLHDVGKTSVPSEVLNKPGKLDAREWELMKSHTTVGDDIVAELDFPWDIRPMVRSHHERWDGRGYPDGLAGTDIPLTARILCVADIFDALTTTRSYRPAYTVQQALALMSEDSGRAVDPDLFETFRNLLSTGEIAPGQQPRHTA
jgi:putative nucleotidyltransferase with HDIG domain